MTRSGSHEPDWKKSWALVGVSGDALVLADQLLPRTSKPTRYWPSMVIWVASFAFLALFWGSAAWLILHAIGVIWVVSAAAGNSLCANAHCISTI